jgi:ATP-dependent helicase HrpB
MASRLEQKAELGDKPRMALTLPKLPIDDALPALRTALDTSGSAVLVAPPGAGKTTRVPLALLEAGWRGDGRIIMLEPRRVAARAAAQQMARLLGKEVGGTVGYRVRLDSRVSARTRIEVVTEGVFTRRILADPELSGVAAVLFDEFHERSLDADFGLALALDARALRPDLRLVVMSATLDTGSVAGLLDNCPVIEAKGRAFEVATLYRPAPADARLEDQLARVVGEALAAHEGSALIFVPGQAEMRRTAERLAGRLPADCDLFTLSGQQRPQEQDAAIRPAPPGRRKVVLATAVAQTSLTIEDVRIVVDSGLARLPAYDPATGLASLITKRVSQAAAEQRRGRAGRVAPGVCYRLWAEGQTRALIPFDPPEITEADLSGLVLDCAAWGVRDPDQLRFPTPPPPAAWREAVELLRALGALDEAGAITPEGKAMARFPVHPRLAHMLARGTGTLAAELAVLLGERGLGGDAVDLASRLDGFRRDRSPRAEDARRLARRWIGDSHKADNGSLSIGALVALAYPDRLAQRTGAGRYRLANGRGARLDPALPLAREPFLAVAEVSGDAAQGQIRAAAAIDGAEIRELLSARITSGVTLEFDVAAGAVRARKTTRLDALVLAEAQQPVPASAEVSALLTRAASQAGIGALGWSRAQRQLRQRASFLHRTLGAPWPNLSDDALGLDVEHWLEPVIGGLSRLDEIDAETLEAALALLLPHAQRRELDALLPSHFEAPTGSRILIDYEAENGPAISVRVQELFGLDRHPSIAGGRLPLLVILLSPAQRPIQTTRDLPGFWRGSWKDVARDLKGRYPRHPWPDDPLAAPPTRRAKPRAG